MNTVRHVMNSARYDWLRIRIGGQRPTIQGNWVALVAALAVIFISFFAIGRTSHGGAGGAPHGEASGTVQAAVVKAQIPASLTGGPPIEGAVRTAIASAAAREARAQSKAQPVSGANLRAPANAQSLTAEAPQSSATTSESEPSSPSTPAAAPAPSTSSGESRSSSPPAAKPTTHAPSPSSGGRAFDTSE